MYAGPHNERTAHVRPRSTARQVALKPRTHLSHPYASGARCSLRSSRVRPRVRPCAGRGVTVMNFDQEPRSVDELEHSHNTLPPSVYDSNVCNRHWLRAAARELDSRRAFSTLAQRALANPLCTECEDTRLMFDTDPYAGNYCSYCPTCAYCGVNLSEHEGYNETWSSSDLLTCDRNRLLVPPGPCAASLFGGM